MSFVDTQYASLVSYALSQGVRADRTGVGTRSFLYGAIRHDMRDGFPALTIKRLAWHQVVTELLWFLRGDTDIKYLVENGCNIWNGDAYNAYLNSTDEPHMTMSDFIKQINSGELHQDLGPIYGHQWRKWTVGHGGIDQIAQVYDSLRNNPFSRRHIVSAWNVGDLSSMSLPPCHYTFQFYVTEMLGEKYLSLMWNQRSVDLFLGLPFNIASYGLLLHIMADAVGMIPHMLIGSFADCHLYENHTDAAKELLKNKTSRYDYPKLSMSPSGYDVLFKTMKISPYDFKLNGYECYPTIKAKLNNG